LLLQPVPHKCQLLFLKILFHSQSSQSAPLLSVDTQPESQSSTAIHVDESRSYTTVPADFSVPSSGIQQLPLLPSIRQNTHPMQTRSKSGIVQHRIHPTLLLAHMEPKSTKQALADPTWLAAMKAEYDALIKNGTWSLVSLPPIRVPIGCKWVFRITKIQMVQ